MVESTTSSHFEWPPLESSPEIFTKYMHQIGLPRQWAFSEVMGFDDELLAFIPQPVLAVIINVSHTRREEDVARGSLETQSHFYMKQKGSLDNACGIIACLHAILNQPFAIEPVEGSTLSQFFQNSLG